MQKKETEKLLYLIGCVTYSSAELLRAAVWIVLIISSVMESFISSVLQHGSFEDPYSLLSFLEETFT